jgi:hypothetical protein
MPAFRVSDLCGCGHEARSTGIIKTLSELRSQAKWSEEMSQFPDYRLRDGNFEVERFPGQRTHGVKRRLEAENARF